MSSNLAHDLDGCEFGHCLDCGACEEGEFLDLDASAPAGSQFDLLCEDCNEARMEAAL